MTSGALAPAVAVAVAVAACGGSGAQTAGQPTGRFPVVVSEASFPARQRLAEQTELVIAVRNAGRRTIPDVAVTLVNPRYGTAAQALGRLIAPTRPGQPILASRSRPVWVIDRDPDSAAPCTDGCEPGGPGGAATAYSNTWALGRLEPGATARFIWHVTAVAPGRYTVSYQVSADPVGGAARAVGADGRPVRGSFTVAITSCPPVPHVSQSGQVTWSG